MKKIIALSLLFLLIAPSVAFAQNPCMNTQTGQEAATALPRCINQIYVWSMGVAALLAFLMIVLGGYFIMTAGGNAEQSTKGKGFITSSLMGMVILFAAYLLLNQINPDLVNFNLNSLKGLDADKTKTQNQGPIRGGP